MATRRLTTACRRANWIAPTAIVTDSTAGSATGIDATVSTSEKRRISISRIVANNPGEHDHHDHRHRDQNQVVPDIHDGFLEMAPLLFSGPRHQRHGVSEKRVEACRGHDGEHLAHLDDGVSIRDLADGFVDRHRLPRERGLVGLQIRALDEFDVRRHHVAYAEFDNVARHEFAGIDLLPMPVPQGQRLAGELFLEQLQRFEGRGFLTEIDDDVDQQQNDDDREVFPLPHGGRENRRDFNHPGNRPPKPLADAFQQRFLFFGDFVAAGLLLPASDVFIGKPAGRVGFELAQRVVHRRRLELRRLWGGLSFGGRIGERPSRNAGA